MRDPIGNIMATHSTKDRANWKTIAICRLNLPLGYSLVLGDHGFPVNAHVKFPFPSKMVDDGNTTPSFAVYSRRQAIAPSTVSTPNSAVPRDHPHRLGRS